MIKDRKVHPKEGSYTNYLFDKGIDKILKKLGEEATEIVIAAKNPNPNEVKYEISDFLYHMMVLMAEKMSPGKKSLQSLQIVNCIFHPGLDICSVIYLRNVRQHLIHGQTGKAFIFPIQQYHCKQ